jgi:hypothetical protein
MRCGLWCTARKEKTKKNLFKRQKFASPEWKTFNMTTTRERDWSMINYKGVYICYLKERWFQRAVTNSALQQCGMDGHGDPLPIVVVPTRQVIVIVIAFHRPGALRIGMTTATLLDPGTPLTSTLLHGCCTSLLKPKSKTKIKFIIHY